MVSVPRISSVSTTVREIVPQATSKASTKINQEVAAIISPKVDPEETLNLLYRTLPVDAERKLENFNGERRISVYRGANYMNKITQRIKEPCVTFIRAMKNAGTAENPKMATKALILDIPNKKDALEIYFEVPGDSMKGVFINLFREGYATTVQRFANLAELRKDPDVMRIIEGWTGKKLT